MGLAALPPDLNSVPAGTGITPTHPVDPNLSTNGYWLCQFDVRVDLPSTMTTSNMESFMASVLANALYANGLQGNSQVTLIATSGGSVANPTTPASVAVHKP